MLKESCPRRLSSTSTLTLSESESLFIFYQCIQFFYQNLLQKIFQNTQWKKYHLFKVCNRGLFTRKFPHGPEVWLKLLLQSFKTVLNFFVWFPRTGLKVLPLNDLAFSRIFL
jgi:hypothetical protein